MKGWLVPVNGQTTEKTDINASGTSSEAGDKAKVVLCTLLYCRVSSEIPLER